MEAQSKTIDAYNALKECLIGDTFVKGQKLIYIDLEAKLGMSRTPITNALSLLEQEEYVVLKLNRGYYVAENSIKDWNEIFETREKLEEIALDLAIKRYNDEDLKVLKGKLDEYIEYSSPIYDRKRVKLDTEFHMQIVRMSKNSPLTNLVNRFLDKVYFTLDTKLLMPYIGKFRKEHKMLYNAIKSKDVVKAKKISRIHYREAYKAIINQ